MSPSSILHMVVNYHAKKHQVNFSQEQHRAIHDMMAFYRDLSYTHPPADFKEMMDNYDHDSYTAAQMMIADAIGLPMTFDTDRNQERTYAYARCLLVGICSSIDLQISQAFLAKRMKRDPSTIITRMRRHYHLLRSDTDYRKTYVDIMDCLGLNPQKRVKRATKATHYAS